MNSGRYEDSTIGRVRRSGSSAAPNPVGEQRVAALYVARHAKGAGDCALLLDLLGLTEVATGSRGTPAA